MGNCFVPTTEGKTVIGYYASWQWYDRAQLAEPQNMDFSKVDRVNYAFFQTDESGNLYGTDSWADPNILFGPYDYNPPDDAPEYCSHDAPGVENCATHFYDQGLLGRAHATNTQVWPSIGGWTLSDNFPVVAANPTARSNFAKQCVELITDYGFDGIDIDWEYPGFEEHGGTPEDRINFNLLLSDIRGELNDLTKKTGHTYGLSAALSCDPEEILNYDVEYLSNVLSELNLMTYDFHGWGPTGYDVDSCVRNWIAAGAAPSAINIGLPFYGRSFTIATGLNQPFGGADVSHWGADDGIPEYYNILDQLAQMEISHDNVTETPYAYFPSGGMVSYDDPRSICEKTQYAIDHYLHGFLIWELSGDLLSSDLST
ncbi:chit1, partial [Symbiodinium microadriaticum]